MPSAAEVFASVDAILLDFDGPVCAVFTGLNLAAEVEAVRSVLGWPRDSRADYYQSEDPLDLLRFAAGAYDMDRNRVESLVRAIELRGVSAAELTPGVREVISAVNSAGRPIALVSNNSVDAMMEFSQLNEGVLDGLPMFGRVPERPDLLKPDPFLPTKALRCLGVTAPRAVLIGDSVSDIAVANRIGLQSIAFVNKARKEEALLGAGPTAAIRAMAELLTS